MPKIFISYRREDSQWPVDRIHAALKPHVADPKSDIFVDVDNIPVGVDFTDYLDAKVAQCDVLLAIIGPDWLNIRNPRTGGRRLDDPKDFVRIEIASALKRGIPVAPVLLDGAAFPDAGDLPEDLRPLVRRNGVEVNRLNFEADINRLIRGLGLDQPASGSNAAAGAPRASAVKTGSGAAGWIFGAVALLALGGVGAWGYGQGWFGKPQVDASSHSAVPAGSLAKADDLADGGAWRMAEGVKSPEAYKTYLEAYPSGAHVAEAKAALDKFADDADWTKAAGHGRAEVEAYLAAHPSGAHVEDARGALARIEDTERQAAAAKSEAERQEIQRRADLQREADRQTAAKQADDGAWAIAASANTAPAFQAYLSRYPYGANASSARAAISNLNKAAPFDLSQLNLEVRAAVERARAAETTGQQRAADGRHAGELADQAAARARTGAAGTRNSADAAHRWEAETANGKINGYGVLTFLSGDYAGFIYHGQWRDDRYSGLGVFNYADTTYNTGGVQRFEGELIADNYSGYGSVTWRDGMIYSGGFKDNGRSGVGILRWAAGMRYEGEWAGDKRNGLGVYWNSDGSILSQGRWKDDNLAQAMTK